MLTLHCLIAFLFSFGIFCSGIFAVGSQQFMMNQLAALVQSSGFLQTANCFLSTSAFKLELTELVINIRIAGTGS